MVFYFLEEIENNNFLKYVIICNAYEFFFFDCKDLFFLKDDKEIIKFYKNCVKNEGIDFRIKRFYSDLEEYLKKDFEGEFCYIYFNLSGYDFKEEFFLIY